MNLLMVSSDTAIVRGQKGPFYNTLSQFAGYWNKVDILMLPVPGITRYDCFDNVTFYPSPWHKRLQPLFILRRGRQLAAERDYSLIVSHDYGLFMNGLGAARLSRAIGVPYVSEIHHVEGHPRAANLRDHFQRRLTRHYVRWARRRALGFRITNDSELRPLLNGWGVPDAQLKLLYSLYLDFEVFHPAPAPRGYDAIFCGRLVSNKAPLLFIDALARAQAQLERPVRALVVGHGPLGAAMRQRAAALGLGRQVQFIDWVTTPTELAAHYRAARCLVCSSYSEGGPRVVAEALACGVPVVTTRVGLAAELVHNDVNGFQVDWSADDIAARLVQIISDDSLQQRLAQAAPQSVQRFEKSQVIRDYAQGYQQWVRDR